MPGCCAILLVSGVYERLRMVERHSEEANHVDFVNELAVHVEAGGFAAPRNEACVFVDALRTGAADADAQAEAVDSRPGACNAFGFGDDLRSGSLSAVWRRDVDAVDVGAVTCLERAVAHEFGGADECEGGVCFHECADEGVATVGFAVTDVTGDAIGVEARVVLWACAESPGCICEHFVAEGDVERGFCGKEGADEHAGWLAGAWRGVNSCADKVGLFATLGHEHQHHRSFGRRANGWRDRADRRGQWDQCDCL